MHIEFQNNINGTNKILQLGNGTNKAGKLQRKLDGSILTSMRYPILMRKEEGMHVQYVRWRTSEMP